MDEQPVTGLSATEAQEKVLEIRDAVERYRGAEVSPEFRAVLDAFEALDVSITSGHEYPTDWM